MIIMLILLSLGSNEAIGYYFSHCDSDDTLDCLFRQLDEPEPEGSVVATGSYTYKGNTVGVTMNIPLDGGAVTGFASDTCEGRVTGDYGRGAINGSMAGACSPFFVSIPASATFTGTLNKATKTVSIAFEGSGGGFSHQGSMTLSYP